MQIYNKFLLFSCGSLRAHKLQHVRIPHPSWSPAVWWNSCPLNQWCHSIIPSSVAPFSFSAQSFTVSGSFPMSQLFASGGQSIGASASASILPVNIQGWFPLGWTGWISLLHLLSLQTPPRTQLAAGEHRGLALCVLTAWPMRLCILGKGVSQSSPYGVLHRVTPRLLGQTGKP